MKDQKPDWQDLKNSRRNWQDDRGMHHSAQMRPRFKTKRGRGIFLFLWFVVVFGFLGVLFIGGLGFVAYLLRVDDSMFTHARGSGRLLVPGLCLGVPLLIFMLARWSRNRISSPLAGILDAAEAIADGDLSTRIPERSHGPFRTVELALNRMAAGLEHSDQQRRDLTADIAHDLNTPLHIIRGYLEGISDGIYQPNEETIGMLLDETNLLSRLVEDLRTLTLADSGELPLHPEEISLAEFLADIRTSFCGQAEAAGINLSVEAEPGLTLFADPDRLDQILINLVANALRSTPAGGEIKLQAGRAAGEIELVVADTGTGISAEDLENIFTRFWRKEKSRDRKDGGGHGLGLAIVRQLVVAQGGSVAVESALDQGTRFILRFPVFE
ncbi:MAG: HAMP domain-containing sensor histidine kinase [Chloroflexota bacterium]